MSVEKQEVSIRRLRVARLEGHRIAFPPFSLYGEEHSSQRWEVLKRSRRSSLRFLPRLLRDRVCIGTLVAEETRKLLSRRWTALVSAQEYTRFFETAIYLVNVSSMPASFANRPLYTR